MDRLVILLETGSTALVRNTAAQQLADIQKQHPHELYNLLARVTPYLRNREWECRIAAGKAIGGIASNVLRWEPNSDESVQVQHDDETLPDIKEEDELDIQTSNSVPINCEGSSSNQLRFDAFDPIQVLRNGRKLLGSSGNVTYS